ncbi:MAG: iron chaperone [Bacteroidota bacterium]
MEKVAKTAPAKNVDAYLKELPSPIRATLQKLRSAIRGAAPKAEELISYQIPTYKYKGALVHFAAFKDHCSFIVVSKDILQIFEKELKPFKTAGTTIRFTPDKPLSTTLVTKIVKTRVQQNNEREL